MGVEICECEWWVGYVKGGSSLEHDGGVFGFADTGAPQCLCRLWGSERVVRAEAVVRVGPGERDVDAAV